LNLGGAPNPYQMPAVPYGQNQAITMAALGMLGAPNIRQGMQNAAQMVPAGLAANTANRRDMYTIQQQNAQRAQMNEALKNWPGLTPEQKAIFTNQPELFGQYALKTMIPPEQTTDIQNYQFAKSQGYPGTFEQWDTERKSAGAPNITLEGNKYGTITPGWMIEETPGGGTRMVPIPEGPADPTKTDKKKRASEVQKADIVTQDIDRVISTTKRIPTWTTGFFGDVLSNVGGTGAGNVSELLSGIKANVGFNQLQSMREASPTGGALGPVSDTENALLQSVLGSVEQSQGQEQLEFNLKRLKNVYLDIIHGEGNGPPREVLDEGGSTWSEPEPGVRIREKP